MEKKENKTEEELVTKDTRGKRKISVRASSSDVLLEDDDDVAELVAENTRLREQKTCKVCMDAEVG